MAFTLTDRTRLKLKLKGELDDQGSYSNTATAVANAHTKTLTVRKTAADAMAADTTASLTMTRLKRASRIGVTLTLTPDGALTADNTNYGSVLLRYDDGAAGAATTLGTFQTTIAAGTGNWVAGTALTVTMATPIDLPVGSRIFVAITKAAAGVAIPQFTIECEAEEI